MNSQTAIQIKKIFENKTGPHKILDTGGNYWKVWPDVYDELNFKENSRYDIQYKKGEYQGKPDNVIKSAFLLESGAVSGAAALGTGPAVAANGHAAPAYNNNPGAAVMGMVNQFIARGDIARDTNEIAATIDVCLQGYLASKLAK